MWVLRRANFLSSFSGKGLFFLYIAIPLLSDGWQEYKGCVMIWQQSLPCPTTTSTDPPAEGGSRSGWMGALHGILSRLFVHSTLVHFAVGVALFSAGVLQLIFAATGPPLPLSHPQQDASHSSGARPDILTDPLLEECSAQVNVSGADGTDVEKGAASCSSSNPGAEPAEPVQRREPGPAIYTEDANATEAKHREKASMAVQKTSWPPAWARSM